MAAEKMQKALLIDADHTGKSIHSRVLGNVIYFMTNLVVEAKQVRGLEDKILTTIKEVYN
jgi:hypothetical protein